MKHVYGRNLIDVLKNKKSKPTALCEQQALTFQPLGSGPGHLCYYCFTLVGVSLPATIEALLRAMALMICAMFSRSNVLTSSLALW